MITWIASYPKSGNTWVRAFLCSYFTSEGKFDFKNLNNIPNFPSDYEINFLRKKYKKFNFFNLASHWDLFQKRLIDTKINIIKTHNALVNFNGYDFTSLKNTIGVIYIIRDPRDVLVSYSNFSDVSYENMFFKMTDMNNFEKTNNYEDKTALTSWDNHYNSWKMFPKNYLLIRYEDLLSDPLKFFTKIINHLSQIYNFQANLKKIEKSINEVKFENLKKIELKHPFQENPQQNISQNKKFFRKGEAGQWRSVLEKNLINKIEKQYSKEMEENNYL